MSRIQNLQDQLDTALSKIDDLENHSRLYNFRIRGLSETITEVQEAVRAFIKDIIPDLQDHRLELDRAHRALNPPRSDGLPRDIVVKPHYYGMKEDVMHISRNMTQPSTQGHPIQVFADLFPSTIQWRRSLKPLLQVFFFVFFSSFKFFY